MRFMRRPFRVPLLRAGVVAAAAVSPGLLAAGPPGMVEARRPQALALVPAPQSGGGSPEWLLVGNRSGSVSVLDAGDLTLLGETRIGGNITSLAGLGAAAGAGRIIAVDHANHRLVVLRAHPDSGRPGKDGTAAPFPAAAPKTLLDIEGAHPTCRYPMRAAVHGDTMAVSCLWTREVLVYAVAPDPGAGLTAPRARVELPFEAQELLFLGDRGGNLLVADGFGGGLAVIDAAAGTTLRTIELGGHNLHGLAILPGGDRIAIAHQHLHSGMHTTSDDIRWGVFITNSVSMLRTDDLLSGDRRLERRTRVLDLGTVSMPSGDPAGIAVLPDGRFVTALSGVGRVAFGARDARQVTQAAVGTGPSALALSGDGRLFVANTWSDSVSVVSVDDRTEIAQVPLGPPARLAAWERGELLFHDARLSLRGWMSCASCHTRGHTNHRLSDTLGDGNYGAPKRVLSLLGVRDTSPWAWDGRMRSLEAQVEKSVRTTLRGRELTEAEVADVAAYLRTLDLPEVPSPSPVAVTGEGARVLAAGREAFSRYACVRCHREPAYTSAGVHDVGLVDELGTRRFNAPSLRGVRFRRTLLHDGSAKSLEDVLEVHPGHGVVVAADDLRDLIAYLKTL